MKRIPFILLVILTYCGIARAHDFDIWTFFNHNANVTGPGSFDSMAAIGIWGDIIRDETKFRYHTAAQYVEENKPNIVAANSAGVKAMPEFYATIAKAQQIVFQIDSRGDDRYRGHENWQYFKYSEVGTDREDATVPSGYARFVEEGVDSAGVVFDTLCLNSSDFLSYINTHLGCRAIYRKYSRSNNPPYNEDFRAILKIYADSASIDTLADDETLCIFKVWVAETLFNRIGPINYSLKDSLVITPSELTPDAWDTVSVEFNLDNSDRYYLRKDTTFVIQNAYILNFSLYWTGKGKLGFDEIEIQSERYDSLINGNYDDEIDYILDSLDFYVSYWTLRDEPYPSLFSTSYKLDSIFVAKGSVRSLQNYELGNHFPCQITTNRLS